MLLFCKPPRRVTEILIGIEKGEMVPPLLARQSLIEPLFHGEGAFFASRVI
jgi:hypothetical protein